MRLLRASLTAWILLVATVASADRHRAERVASLGGGGGSHLFGIEVSHTLPIMPNSCWFEGSLIGSGGYYQGGKDSTDLKLVPFSLGVVWTFPEMSSKKMLPILQVQGGGVWTQEQEGGSTREAVKWQQTFSGGLEFPWKLPFSDRGRVMLNVFNHRLAGEWHQSYGISVGISAGYGVPDPHDECHPPSQPKPNAPSPPSNGRPSTN